MPDLYQRVPANRSFRDVVNGTPNPLRNAWKETGNGGQYSAKSARAFGLSLFRPMALCAAVTLAGLCSSIYCAVGYVHYKRVAGTERAGTQQAERANNDLQKKLDGIRDQLGVAKARINTLAGEAAPPVTVSAQDKIDPAAHWIRPLGQPDLQLSDPQPTAKPSQQASTLSDGHLQQSWTRITLDETENKTDPNRTRENAKGRDITRTLVTGWTRHRDRVGGGVRPLVRPNRYGGSLAVV